MGTSDIEIYNLAQIRRKTIIISKDIDFREPAAWNGTPPKLIFLSNMEIVQIRFSTKNYKLKFIMQYLNLSMEI